MPSRQQLPHVCVTLSSNFGHEGASASALFPIVTLVIRESIRMASEAAAHAFLEKLSAPVEGLNGTLLVRSEVVADCESLLTSATALLDPSTDTGQVFLDHIGLELPCIVVKYAAVSQTCCKMSESILKNLLDFCNPRDMFTAYMEALHLYTEPESLNLCPLILDGLVTVFTRLRTRKPEFLRDAVPGLLNTARLAMDTGVEVFHIFDKLTFLITTFQHISTNEQVQQQQERLWRMLGIFALLLLARSSNYDQLDDSNGMHSVVLQLVKLLPSFGFMYANLLTGCFLEEKFDAMSEEGCSEDVQLTETRRGAAFAVYWILCHADTADGNHEAIESLRLRIKGSKHASIDALFNVMVLLVPQGVSWRTVENGIAALSTILDLSMEPAGNSCRFQLAEWNVIKPKLEILLQAIQNVIIYCPKSNARKQAYEIFVKIISQFLPPMERYMVLKSCITNCEHPSMAALLLGIVKEESGKAINSRKEAATESGDSSRDSGLESPFASKDVLELIEYVLRPSRGGPDLPNHTDAVLAVLNLYRFLLIREVSGNTNYTGISSKVKLQEAYSNWFLPLCSVLQCLRRSLSDDTYESNLYILLSLTNLEAVLYRCIELVEEALKNHCN